MASCFIRFLLAALLSALVCKASEVPAEIANDPEYSLLGFTGCGDPSYNRSFVIVASDCAEVCRAEPQCGAFTVNVDNLRCYLKSSCDELEPKTNNFSGIKLAGAVQAPIDVPVQEAADTVIENAPAVGEEANEDPEGVLGDYEVYEYEDTIELEEPTYTTLPGIGCSDDSYFRSGGADEDSCRAACSADPQCGAFTVNTRNDKCYLKKTCASAQRKSDNLSGLKEGTALPLEIVEASPPPPSPLPPPPTSPSPPPPPSPSPPPPPSPSPPPPPSPSPPPPTSPSPPPPKSPSPSPPPSKSPSPSQRPPQSPSPSPPPPRSPQLHPPPSDPTGPPPSPPAMLRKWNSVFYGYPALYCDAEIMISKPAKSTRACRLRCENNRKCMAYSYHVVNGDCELKGVCRAMIPNAPWFSGFTEPNPESWYP